MPDDAPSPADELQRLEDDLEENQKDAERLKAQIAALKKTAGEVEQKTKDLGKAFEDLKKKKEELDAFVAREKAMLEEIVDEEDIKARKKAVLDELQGLAGDVDQASGDLQLAQDNYAAAQKATAVQQAAFNKVAGVAARNAEILKDALSLRDKANEADKANNFSRKYFLVLLLEDRLAELDTSSVEDYEKTLNEAASDLTDATNAELEAKNALTAAVAALKQAQKKLDDRKGKWREEVLQAIPTGNDRNAQPPARQDHTTPTPPPA